MKIIVAKNKKIKNKIKIKIVIVKNNIAIRVAGKVSRYIDASMNRATPNCYLVKCMPTLVDVHFVARKCEQA